MYKRGIGHVEVIMAFVLFMGAMFFIFTFINVRQTTLQKDSTITYISNNLHKGAETKVTIYSVVLSKSLPSEEQIVAITLPVSVLPASSVYAENSAGSKRDITISAEPSERNIVYVNRQDSFFVRILVNEDLPAVDEPTDTVASDPSKYTISSSETDTLLSEKRLLDLKQEYEADYGGLKSHLQLPDSTNFNWRIVFTEQDFIKMEQSIPAGLDVTANNKREEILRTTSPHTGERAFADTNLQIW